MNRADARAKHSVHGWIGEYRLAWKATYQSVLNITPDGRRAGVRYFPSEAEAEIEAWRSKNDAEQNPMTCSGYKMAAARSAAEQIFKPGRKPIPVTTNKRVRA